MSHVNLPRSIVHPSCDSCPYCPPPSSSQRTPGTQTPAVALRSWSFNRQSSIINRPFSWSAYPEWSWLSIDSRRPAAAYSQPMLAPLAEEGQRLLRHVFEHRYRLSGDDNEGEGSGPWGMPLGYAAQILPLLRSAPENGCPLSASSRGSGRGAAALFRGLGVHGVVLFFDVGRDVDQQDLAVEHE